jgi:hypothetical protein
VCGIDDTSYSETECINIYLNFFHLQSLNDRQSSELRITG